MHRYLLGVFLYRKSLLESKRAGRAGVEKCLCTTAKVEGLFFAFSEAPSTFMDAQDGEEWAL